MNNAPAQRQDFGQRPQLTWLPIANLGVSPEYQRSLETPSSKRLIAKIAQGFRWSAFGTILATPDGFERWLIIDGQHRVEGAKAVGISTVPAVVIEEANAQEQAQAFVRANRDRVPMSAQALYHARVLAGDKDALIIAGICRDAGIQITRHNVSAIKVPARKTAAVPALLRMLRFYGEDTTRAAVKAVVEVYGKEAGTLRAPFFMAAAAFLHQKVAGPNGLSLALIKVGWPNLEAAAFGLGGSSAIPELVTKLRLAIEPARTAPKPTPAPKPPAPPVKSATDDRAPVGQFTDDPRAKRDRGSLEKLPAAEPFGRSSIGSTLAN